MFKLIGKILTALPRWIVEEQTSIIKEYEGQRAGCLEWIIAIVVVVGIIVVVAVL